MCTGSCSAPRQGLPGDRQGPLWFFLEPFKNKVFKPRRQGPGKRSLPGRPTKISQGTCRDAPRVPARPGERQASGSDKTTTAARRLPRRSHHPVPMIQRIRRRVATGSFQAHVAGGCAAKRCEVADGADKEAIVAIGGAPNGRFSALFGRHGRAFNALAPCRQS